MTAKDNIEKKLEELGQAIGPDDSVVESVMSRVHAEPVGESERVEKPQNPLFRRFILNRFTKVAAAVVVVVAVLVGIDYWESSGSALAFGEVLENLARVQTLHAKWDKNGKQAEVWAKRPNMLRMEYDNGTYGISNGPEMWIVDEKNNKVTHTSSWYFKDAQRRGIDVVDALARMQYTDDLSGFFSEGPTKRITQNGRLFDVYQMELDEYGNRIEFEALVDCETHLIHSMRVKILKDKHPEQVLELVILDYDQPIPDSKFIFEPTERIQVIVEEPEDMEPVAVQTEGSTLSGRVVWASTGKPVGGARLTFGGAKKRDSDGVWRSKFFVRAETDRHGFWQISGAPKGPIDIRVRSWELEWPAMPMFATNAGSPLHPRIVVDGQSDYGGLDFKVCKPKNFFARITINVTNEDGEPIEGVGGLLAYVGDDFKMHQHIYAVPRKQQFTGADGQFDAADIWPTNRPVQIQLGHRSDLGSTYVTRDGQTEPFVIEPKESYHFDIVLPYPRWMKVHVVDPENRPLEDVSVMLLDKRGFPFYPLNWIQEPIFTNAEGLVDVGGMAPGEDLIIALERLGPDEKDPRNPLASACIPSAAPSDTDKPISTVVLDERPIYIEGTADSVLQLKKGFVSVCLEAGKLGTVQIPFLSTTFDNSGRFILKGVPAGHIRPVYTYMTSVGCRKMVGEVVTTEPGNTYVIKTDEQGVQLIDKKPNP